MEQWSMRRALEHSPASSTSFGRRLGLLLMPGDLGGGPPRSAAAWHSRQDQAQWQREASIPQTPSTLVEGHVHAPELLGQGKVVHMSHSQEPHEGPSPIPFAGTGSHPRIPPAWFIKWHMGYKARQAFPDLPTICSGFILAAWPPRCDP